MNRLRLGFGSWVNTACRQTGTHANNGISEYRVPSNRFVTELLRLGSNQEASCFSQQVMKGPGKHLHEGAKWLLQSLPVITLSQSRHDSHVLTGPCAFNLTCPTAAADLPPL